MNFFELELDEKSRVSTEFMARVVNELKRAISTEKKERKITQQGIANAIGTSRAVINRQVQGIENLSARRIAEILWAIGWEPHFEARPIPRCQNDYVEATATRPAAHAISSASPQTASSHGNTIVRTFEQVGATQ